MRAPTANPRPSVRADSTAAPESIAAARLRRDTPALAKSTGITPAAVPPSRDRLLDALAEAVRNAIAKDARLLQVEDGRFGSMKQAAAKVGQTSATDVDRPTLTVIQGGRGGSIRP